MQFFHGMCDGFMSILQNILYCVDITVPTEYDLGMAIGSAAAVILIIFVIAQLIDFMIKRL